MILQVRIPNGLQMRFSYVRSLKGLPARTCERASCCKSPSLRQSSWRALQFMFACWHQHVNGKLTPGLRCNKENAQNSQCQGETTAKVMRVFGDGRRRRC